MAASQQEGNPMTNHAATVLVADVRAAVCIGADPPEPIRAAFAKMAGGVV